MSATSPARGFRSTLALPTSWCNRTARPHRAASPQIAFHFEVPMVLTDVGGLAEMVPHETAGFVVPPGDPEALADAVARYVVGDWQQRLTEGVRAQEERYAPARLAEAVERLVAEGL